MRGALLAWWRRELVAVTVRGASMEPAYRDGDRVLVRRGGGVVGDVVVVEQPSVDGTWDTSPLTPRGRRWMIKRLAAVAGDAVPLGVPGGTVVPAGKVVVLGDNRAASLDSRLLGCFPADRVLGVVLHRPSTRC